MSVPEGGDYDLTVHQGTAFSITFAARESDETTVIPLTGYTGRAQIRKTSGSLIADFDVDVDGPAGTVTLSLTAAQTSAIDHSGLYDVKLVPGSGDPIAFLGGSVTLKRQVTQP